MNHRLEILGELPYQIGVAVSGGPDSMAVLDFLVRGGRQVTAFHFNHGTQHGQEAEAFVTNYCETNKIDLVIGRILREKAKGESPEEYWRNERYNFLDQKTDFPIVCAHNLDDQIEAYLFSTLHGEPRLIQYQRGHIIRPFLTTRKEAFLGWCERKGVPFVVDQSNYSDQYMRSFIRQNMVPQALRVNPGLYKVIKKKVLKDYRAWVDDKIF